MKTQLETSCLPISAIGAKSLPLIPLISTDEWGFDKSFFEHEICRSPTDQREVICRIYRITINANIRCSVVITSRWSVGLCRVITSIWSVGLRQISCSKKISPTLVRLPPYGRWVYDKSRVLKIMPSLEFFDKSSPYDICVPLRDQWESRT